MQKKTKQQGALLDNPMIPIFPQWRLRHHHTRSARRGECCVPWCRHKFSVILFSFNKGTSFPLFSLLWTNCPVQSLQHVLWLQHPGDYRNTQSYFLRQVLSTTRQEWLKAIGFAAGGGVIHRRRRKKWFTFRILSLTVAFCQCCSKSINSSHDCRSPRSPNLPFLFPQSWGVTKNIKFLFCRSKTAWCERPSPTPPNWWCCSFAPDWQPASPGSAPASSVASHARLWSRWRCWQGTSPSGRLTAGFLRTDLPDRGGRVGKGRGWGGGWWQGMLGRNKGRLEDSVSFMQEKHLREEVEVEAHWVTRGFTQAGCREEPREWRSTDVIWCAQVQQPPLNPPSNATDLQHSGCLAF